MANLEYEESINFEPNGRSHATEDTAKQAVFETAGIVEIHAATPAEGETAKTLLIMDLRYRNNGFMRCSILLLVSFAIAAQAQPASQEEINRALEVLHKTPAVAPPPVARPGVPLKITSTLTNAAPAAAPVRPQVQTTPVATSPMTEDMERRAREVLSGIKTDQRPQPTPNPAREAIERANASEQLRKQAIEETRRGLPQTNSNRPATLAQEEQQKAQQELDRQKNLERIEMEVQRARIARQQKAAAQAEASKTNAPAPTISAAQTNAPAKTVTNAPAPAVAVTKTNAPAPKAAPMAPKAPAPAVAVAPPPATVPPAAQPIKPAPVMPAAPVTPPPSPQPVIVQQTPAPAPGVVPAPAPPATYRTNGAFKALAPDMEQRARDILEQVMSNTKGATLPPLATQPPKATPVIPAPQPQAQPPQPQAQPETTTAATPAKPPVKGPDATPAPDVVVTPGKGTVTKPIAPDQEAKAREILEQMLARPVPESAPTPTPAPPPSTAVQKPTPTPVVVERQPAPAPTPAPPAVQQRQPAPVVTTKAPTATPKLEVSKPMAPDQEAKARELLNRTLSSLPAPTPAPAAPSVTSKPIESPTPTPPVPAPAPSTPVVTKAPIPAPQPESATALPPDREAKARELLNQTLSSLPAPTITPAPSTTVETKIAPDMDKRAQEDARRQAKLKAEIEDQTRREIARMEEESQARAREMAKRRIEEDKRAQSHKTTTKTEIAPVAAAKPAPAPVRHTPEPTESKPVPQPVDKPKRVKSNGDAKTQANAPVQETWKDSGKAREQRLSELLDAYRKDQISAEKYHSERAKILASQ